MGDVLGADTVLTAVGVAIDEEEGSPRGRKAETRERPWRMFLWVVRGVEGGPSISRPLSIRLTTLHPLKPFFKSSSVGTYLYQSTTILSFFEKLENPDPKTDAKKLISRQICNEFLVFFSSYERCALGFKQCSVSMTFWCGSGSGSTGPCL
jgi:hypothetical protein